MLGDRLAQRGGSPLCRGASGLHWPLRFLRHPLQIHVTSVAMSVSRMSGGVLMGPAHIPGRRLVPACLLSRHQHLHLLCQRVSGTEGLRIVPGRSSPHPATAGVGT